MNPCLEKFKKILNLETSRGYDNKAVFGGLKNFIPKWEIECEAGGVDPSIVQKIVSLIDKYSASNKAIRESVIHDILTLIDTREEITIRNSINNPVITGQGSASTPSNNSVKINISTRNTLDFQITPSLTSIPSIGKSREKVLMEAGIGTIEDLIYHFPRKYLDYRQISTIAQLKFGEQVTIIASVKSISARKTGNRKLHISELILDDDTGSLRVSFFNQPYLAFQIKKGDTLAIKGKVEMYLGRFTINSPEWELLDSHQQSIQGISAHYSLPAGFSQRTFRKVIQNTLEVWSSQLIDYLPANLRTSENLMEFREAIYCLHQPADFSQLEKAVERVSFDQVFFLQMGVLAQKANWTKRIVDRYLIPEDVFSQITESLPYRLTESQIQALNEIREDLASGKPMNRLLQGDVGSGKTIVALIASAIVFTENGSQCAIMAPTGILAEQHFKSAVSFFQANRILPIESIRLLTGDTSIKEKEETIRQLLNGEIRLLIGTHSLLEEPVNYYNLQLAIIDEQHRFGVEQRNNLIGKGPRAHLLAMTATPIPRSLALTVYGDLDISIMRGMPQGRKSILTRMVHPNEREKVYRILHEKVLTGQQAFIVYPLIESEEGDEKRNPLSASNEFNRLKSKVFPKLTLALLHGKIKPEQKDAIMKDFRDGKIHILVSTTVIEVGVDIPNASIMVIEGANRFGLAQLHQLRGRIGRGPLQSFCFLIPDSEDALTNNRLNAVEQTNDGFLLADIDLQQRGPGDFIGSRQSGFKELSLQNIMNVELIEKARGFAELIFNLDPQLEKPEHKEMKKKLNYFWSSRIGEMN